MENSIANQLGAVMPAVGLLSIKIIKGICNLSEDKLDYDKAKKIVAVLGLCGLLYCTSDFGWLLLLTSLFVIYMAVA